MFSSIRWRFVVVYFLLVFIAMSIVGVFIIEKLESQQLMTILNNMERQIQTVIEGSSYIGRNNWIEYREELQDTLNDWRLGSKETLYIVYNAEIPTIVASTSKEYPKLIGQNALSSKYMEPSLIIEAFNGEKSHANIEELNEGVYKKHLAYPLVSELGEVRGAIYMTSDLSDAYNTVKEAKVILRNATFLALIITVFLGFIIANSITVPIRDLTKKAEEMAEGDFNQFVEVKSDDEIGQLANMFNYLTLELKNTIQEIDYERSKLDTIFHYMAEGVIAVNRKNEIIHANIIAMDLLDLEKKDLLESRPIDFKKINIKSIDYDDIDSLEGTRIAKISSKIYRVKHAPFKNKLEEENIGGIIIVLQDITKEHSLDNMRKEFVANVSHELKTPITTIKSYTETLLGQDIDAKTRLKFLEVINDEADRMNNLVRDLLQLSNLDYKKVRWKKVELDINKLIIDLSDKLSFSLSSKEDRISLDLDPSCPKIYADKYAIEQVLSNILSNAIKYSGLEDLIYISSQAYKRDKICISIRDTGPGIAEEDLNRIFERFYRVEKGRSRELGGTGLGLSIAREIVEGHGGSLDINSKKGIGTEVKIILPV